MPVVVYSSTEPMSIGVKKKVRHYRVTAKQQYINYYLVLNFLCIPKRNLI